MSEIYDADDVDGLTVEDLHRLLTNAPRTCRDLRRTMRADDVPLDAKLGAAVDLLIRSVERIDKLEGVILNDRHKDRWSAVALAASFIGLDRINQRQLLGALLSHFENVAPDDVPALAVKQLLEALTEEPAPGEVIETFLANRPGSPPTDAPAA